MSDRLNRREFVVGSAGLAAASSMMTLATAQEPLKKLGRPNLRRPVIAIDIKLKHLSDPSTGKTIGPDQYETDFAYRDRYQIFNRYVDVIQEAGALPLLVPCFTEEKILREYLDMADGFLCVGLNDYPPELYREPRRIETQVKTTVGYKRHAESNMILARLVFEENAQMPLLGICAGPQLFNIARGGKLTQHLPTAADHIAHSQIRDREHQVWITGGRILKRLFGTGPIVVNTNHHQAADPDYIGKGLQAVARTDDGVIEALESTDDRFVLGVQWHPERMRDSNHRRKLFGAFITAAREYRATK